MHDQAIDALAADDIRAAGERAKMTGEYRCRCCRRTRLFILGGTFVECPCHKGARWWGLRIDEQEL